MSVVKGNGAPRKNTKGAVGDTYMDLETGKNYRCVSIFRDSLGYAEYEWGFIGVSTDESTVKSQKITPEEADRTTGESKPVTDKKPEYNRHNYNKQYRGQKPNKN